MKAQEEITKLKTFQDFISRYEIVYPDKLFFRGEKLFFSNRTPGILRKDSYLKHESDFYSDLQKMHQSEFINQNDFIDKLALMQHYGAPTRLLDMSVNPYISLYFACEETDDPEDSGYVYMYVQNPVHKDDPVIRILSWLACNQWDSLEEACQFYEVHYGQPVNIEEIRKSIARPQFIFQKDFNDSGNVRLKAQQGTFVICGEKQIEDKWTITTLDSVLPVLVFRVPKEFKRSIRNELEHFGINESTIYTDLASAAEYLRDKYNPQTETIDENDYEIKETDTTSPGYRRSLKMKVVFKKKCSIMAIHNTLKSIVENNKDNADVIWIYASMSKEDYVANNYRTRMLWINPDWEYKDKLAPEPFGTIENESYSWDDSNNSSILSEYYDENIFSQSNEYIYKSAYTLFDKAVPIVTLYEEAWKAGGKSQLQHQINKTEDEVNEITENWNEIGIPVDRDAKLFLHYFDRLFIDLSLLSICLKSNNYEFLVNDTITRMQQNIKEIQVKKEWLKEELNIDNAKLEQVVPLSEHREKYRFIQTIPMSDKPLNVFFNVHAFLTDEKNIQINCDTNLYDHAELKITVFDAQNNKKIGKAKGCIENGHVDFEKINLDDSIKIGSSIKVKIGLSDSSLQNIEFVKQAGILYENISDSFIDRSSTADPVGNYETTIKLLYSNVTGL